MTTTPPILASPLLAALPGVRHAFFTRQGGVSEGVYDSLNVGLGSDYTIFALVDGIVKFEHKSKTRFKISVYPAQETSAA